MKEIERIFEALRAAGRDEASVTEAYAQLSDIVEHYMPDEAADELGFPFAGIVTNTIYCKVPPVSWETVPRVARYQYGPTAGGDRAIFFICGVISLCAHGSVEQVGADKVAALVTKKIGPIDNPFGFVLVRPPRSSDA